MYKIKIHITGNKYMEELINTFTKLHKFSYLQGEFQTEWGSEPICRSCSSSKGWGCEWMAWKDQQQRVVLSDGMGPYG
jgi:hypothetical protein